MKTEIKPKFQTWWNFKFNIQKHAQRTTDVSLTVPDMSFSLRDILTKFSRGVDPMLTKLGDYEFDTEPDDAIFENESIEYDDLTGTDDAILRLQDIEERKEYLERYIKENAKANSKEEIQPMV